ncbi:hypothetical protein O181_119002, partial [Austropuccinia psidii MF-1]|nr:hypothetical protein [Austropuccinia psidii MF-1]
ITLATLLALCNFGHRSLAWCSTSFQILWPFSLGTMGHSLFNSFPRLQNSNSFLQLFFFYGTGGSGN